MSTRRWRLRAAVAAVAALGVIAVLATDGVSQGSPGHPYLALGDSVTFGYITQAGFEYRNPDNFVGFPTYVGDILGMTPTNAGCPGEATGGFVSTTGTDNGCRPYKANFPLHERYSGTQLQFATSFLNSHPNTKLVTLLLGANDAFVLQRNCNNDPTCLAAGLPGLLVTIRSNLDTILRALQSAHFNGKIVVLNYYSLDYADAAGTANTRLLNGTIEAAAHANGAVVADVFSAFQQAASGAGGHTCAAGLLNASPQNQFVCDVHTSQSGAQLLARTVAATYDNS